MNPSQFLTRHVSIMLLLALAAGLLRFWLAPLLTDVRSDYTVELDSDADAQFRETPDGQWTHSSLIARHTDQVLGDRSEFGND